MGVESGGSAAALFPSDDSCCRSPQSPGNIQNNPKNYELSSLECPEYLKQCFPTFFFLAMFLKAFLKS
ncbi:hypothetical protein WN51_06929 [Melipona quadrifasciata]|uniref:Uncharacterized protein n=1 Tax=Melipona quadrifasciata TaxID=166423 RepID=A0A0M8ZR15_9HYME|nr:hypothetical protein WN51_06929 [Melipona quadrifasciata]